jgi:hypothetical protein
MTALVLIGMGVLLSLNLVGIFSGQFSSQTYLKHNDVRGIAVKHHDLLYTLNFRQQNDVIDFFNRSVQIREMPTGNRIEIPIQQIIIYLFNATDVVLTPIAYLDNNLLYSAPQWNADGYLLDLSDGALKDLLSQTYDP